MRKNYFAKKFVAYSMAFAVAFSTLTVSPVFVKEAKAATTASSIFVTGSTAKYKVKVDAALSSITTKTITNGNVFLSNVTSDDLTDGTSMGIAEFISNSGLEDKLITNYTLEQLSGKISDTAEPNYGLLKAATADVTPTPVKIVTGQEETADLNATGLTANTKYTWFKLVPGKGTFTYPEINNGVARNDVITYNYFTLRRINDVTTATSDDATTTNIDERTELIKSLSATSENAGLYLLAKTADGTIAGFYDVCEKSDLEVTVTKDTVYATKGSTVNITANISSSKNTTCKWYKAGVELKDFENKNVLTLTDVKDSDFVGYTCEVTDGIKTIPLDVTLSELTATEVAKVNADVFNTTKKVLTTTAGGEHFLQNGKINLTTIIPDGDYHYIWLDSADKVVKLSTSDVLAYDSIKKSITITDDSEVKAANDNVVITCYAIPTSVYNANGNIKAALKKLSEATNDADRYAALETTTSGLRDVEATLKGNAVYKEVITLKAVADNTVLASDSKNVTLGSKVTLDAPVLKDELPVAYTWTNANGDTYGTSGSQLVIDNVDQKDLGTITCTVTYCKHATKCADVKTHEQLVNVACDCTDSTHHTYTGSDTTADNAAHVAYLRTQNEDTIVQKINLVYASDLTATGSDVQVRDGQAAELSVTAKASVVPTYKWEKVTETLGANDVITPNATTIPGVKDTEATLKLTTVTKANKDYYTEKFDASSKRYYYQCTVSDGINTIYVPVKITEVETFKVYENATEKYKGTVLGNDAQLYYGGLKGDTITLEPIVVANPDVEKDITFTWKKDGIAYSTDKAVTVNCDGNDATYQLTITEGTAPLVINYNVKTLTEKQLQGATISGGMVDIESNNMYTGKEINPVNKVSVKVSDTGHDYVYALKADTDYKVTLTDAINAGVSKYEVVLTGNFADAYNKLSDMQKDNYGFRGIFTITRADNKVEIADNTVVLGGSVQPKTVTNLGKGALTYTYYADEAATTEIPAPTKVGTYYVKATAKATINYNDAESNVAKVVVVPGKVKMLGTSRTASSVKLNWTKATGATSYRVYYKAAGAKSYKVFKNTTATSMNVTGLASATTYTFAVKAYAKTAGYSTVYATKQTTTAPAKVATPSVTAGSKKATVKFTKVARATGYQIYMAKGNGSYKKVATTKSLSLTKTGLAKGATYKFKVRAYKTVGSNTYYGAFSSAKAVVVK